MPTIFVSAATVDLEKWRDALHGAFSRAGFRVLTQKHSFGAATGPVRRLLTEHIEECDCLIHLAGLGYGSDAQHSFPEPPHFECSWTQFEYYYAHFLSKDVIAFVCAPNLSRPEFREEAKDDDDRKRKSRLQQEHRDRVASGKFDGTPLEPTVERKCNESVESHENLLQAVAAAIGTLLKLGPERLRAQQELTQMAQAIEQIKSDVSESKTHVREMKSDVGEIKSDVEETKHRVARIEAVLEAAAKSASSTPDRNAAALSFKWPHAWSYFRIGGRQTIRWDVFVAHNIKMTRFELELYVEQTFLLAIAGNDRPLAGDCRQYAWQLPGDLQVGNRYRLRLIAWDDAGRLSETFSAPFRMRRLDQTDEGNGIPLAVAPLFGAFLGFAMGIKILAPFLMSVATHANHKEPPYSREDNVFIFLWAVIEVCGEPFWMVVLGIAAAEYCASLTAIAAMMWYQCLPAKAILPVCAVAGVAGGMLLDREFGALWGGFLGLSAGVYAVAHFFRGLEDVYEILEINKKVWSVIATPFRTVGQWLKRKPAE